MTLEIRKPELEFLIEKLRASGANIDELLFSGLNAIGDKNPRSLRGERAPKLLHTCAKHARETGCLKV